MMRKTVWISAFVFAAMAGLAVAANQQSERVEIPYDAAWAGKTLAAGEYTFRWQGDGDSVDVTILRGRRVVAEGKGRIEQQPAKAQRNAVVARPQESGPRLLTKVQFGGKDTVLVLAES